MNKIIHKYLISGGGTGGHIFPAISIANALKQLDPDCEIIFIGAEGHMEMERVPAAGYKIEGLKVEGLDRQHILRNFKVLYNFAVSLPKARRIIKDFQPDVAVGVGGYASAAALMVANSMNIPIVLQEQNGFAGVANKLLAKKACKICVAYTGMERFFPADKVILTGNPIRQNLFNPELDKKEAYDAFGLKYDIPTLLVMGGSLGAMTINNGMIIGLKQFADAGVQVIWQTGKRYFADALKAFAQNPCDNVLVMDFISRMDYAYAVADVVAARAGASTISELTFLGKPAILIPSPNVAEDHQTHNAMALAKENAAICLPDNEAIEKLAPLAINLLLDDKRKAEIATNSKKMAQIDSAVRIANEIIKLCKN
ncbi:MAG: undecaprenyldiphospho-muramoylpentapeptide beta-N-acetylglucosaminyltransferase [Candidatus Aphodosoma sp.]